MLLRWTHVIAPCDLEVAPGSIVTSGFVAAPAGVDDDAGGRKLVDSAADAGAAGALPGGSTGVVDLVDVNRIQRFCGWGSRREVARWWAVRRLLGALDLDGGSGKGSVLLI